MSLFRFVCSRLAARLAFLRSPPPLPEAPGPRAEELAARHLQARGLTILERNHRCRGGEVDLVCRDGNTVVFVEVRLRASEDHGGAAGSITPAKRKRLIMAARHWLAGKPESPCRFDCILLARPEPDAIQWIQGAFPAE